MKRFKNKITTNNKGQATIEFIFSFSFLLFFILFFVTVGLNLAIGYVAHFAVFKASRHYLTYDNGLNSSAVLLQAETQANEIFKTFSELNLNGKFEIHSPYDVIYEYVGAKLLYSPKIRAIGPFSLADDYQFLTESFLGKEPSRADCKCQTQMALGQPCDREIDVREEVTVYDNGC